MFMQCAVGSGKASLDVGQLIYRGTGEFKSFLMFDDPKPLSS